MLHLKKNVTRTQKCISRFLRTFVLTTTKGPFMIRNSFLLTLTLLWLCAPSIKAQSMASPDGNLTIQVKEKGLTVYWKQQPILDIPTVSDNPLSPELAGQVTADYRMLTGKRLNCTNKANEYRSGNLILRVYNDGIAFRYAAKTGETVYRIPEGTRRWMQQWCDSYEVSSL